MVRKILDAEGRLLGKINIVDLAIVAIVCAAVAGAYVKLSAPYRVAPPFSVGASRLWVEVDIQLPPDQAWMEAYALPGDKQYDGRSGEVNAEILGTERPEPGGVLMVRARVLATRDESERLFYDGRRLAPGRQLRLETARAIVEGVVSRLVVMDGSAP